MLLAAMPEKPRPRKNKSKLSASVGRLDSRNSFMEIISFLFVSFFVSNWFVSNLFCSFSGGL